MKEEVVNLLAKNLKLKKAEIENLIEIPPSAELGDYSFPCFSLAKIEKKSPLVIAEELAEKLRGAGLSSGISGVDFKAGYVNFFIDKKKFVEGVLGGGENMFKIKKREKKKVGIEFPSPNTNKSLHVGHLRNMAIGESVLRICKQNGNQVVHLNLFNDRGILISKSMIGYEKYGKGKLPKKNGDEFVGDFYVRFSKESKEKPELEELAKEKLRQWESGDKKTIDLWKKMNKWFYSGFSEIANLFGLTKIDKNYFESDLYLKGKEIVNQGLKEGLFKKEKDNSVLINLEKENLGEKILIRNDGTAVYMTTDLYLAKKKIEDFKLDSSYYVVGCDQEYHFKVLFIILEKLGLKKDWRHLSYGMVTLPSGKMKSREGTAVSARGLIEETQRLAMVGLEKRDNLSKAELKKRSLAIALSAIKYHLLKVDYRKSIVFNPNEALAFEGDTGPYLLYSYARASSIIRKTKAKIVGVKIPADLKEQEIALVKKIALFPDVVEKSYKDLAPNLIANYSFELAQAFNEFYHTCPVLGTDEQNFRLKLTDVFRKMIKKSLDLLGIGVLEEM